MSRDDPHKLADALEREAGELARESDQLRSQLEETRADWERKRADETVPGAPPPERPEAASEGEEPPEASAKG